MGMGITQWESHGKTEKRLKLENGYGKECDLTAWKWGGMGM